MSKIVSFEQAKALRKLGYDFDSLCFCGGSMDCICEHLPDENKLIPVSSALNWVREEKEIACGVYPMHHGYLPNKNPDIHYGFNFYFLEDEKVKMTYSDRYKSHLLAESALLDSLLDYLEKK